MESLKRGDLCKAVWKISSRMCYDSAGCQTDKEFDLEKGMILEAIRWHPEIAARYWLFWVPEANVYTTLCNDGSWFVKL